MINVVHYGLLFRLTEVDLTFFCKINKLVTDIHKFQDPIWKQWHWVR